MPESDSIPKSKQFPVTKSVPKACLVISTESYLHSKVLIEPALKYLQNPSAHYSIPAVLVWPKSRQKPLFASLPTLLSSTKEESILHYI